MQGWTNLSRRQAGLPPETGLVEGVPSHLYTPLDSWVSARLVEGDSAAWDRAQLQAGISRFLRGYDNLLDVIDFVLFWYPQIPPADHLRSSGLRTLRDAWPRVAAELENILATGRSVWRVNGRGDGLELRSEPTVTEAVRQVVASASIVTQDHLQSAWAATYGRKPDPDKAFAEAIKAVEDVACPLVEKKKAAAGGATLGTVIGELRNSHAKWELVLPSKDGQPRDITILVGMLEALWHAQVSRHAGAPKSRRQSQAEAEAAVHLAVTLCQWLSTGVLRRR